MLCVLNGGILPVVAGVTWTTLTVIGTSWSYADGRTLTDGTWNYTVRVVDLAGNVGQTATQNVVVDTTSPEAAKSITITGISDDTGASSSDFITSDTSLTVRGVLGAALGANEFAQISTDNGATWVNVTVAADGLNWSYVDGRTLTNGTTTWQVRVIRMGFGGELVAHGMRSIARTAGAGHFPREVLESALAHQKEDEIEAAYNRSDYLEQRRPLMQWWGNYVDAARRQALLGEEEPLRIVEGE
nr:Ig-like domain-containing protein [Escherichia coli]